MMADRKKFEPFILFFGTAPRFENEKQDGSRVESNCHCWMSRPLGPVSLSLFCVCVCLYVWEEEI